MILNDLEWLSNIFNDTKRGAVSPRQLSFLFVRSDKGLDTCYSAAYMSQTSDQQRFTIS